ncbi:hypothetical protein HPB51_016451 [Rhipicephalus microplus]|uniref:Adiponectin receptor n=1 Tax=Rhipicephalus microplus TaxID=6941 RepID=A0A9J6DVP9_RHIMP|nr:hypothetical protein HPB51_016451 [Rhipicephalus microplus]
MTKASCPTFPTRCPWKKKCSSGLRACFEAGFRIFRCLLRIATEVQTRTMNAMTTRKKMAVLVFSATSSVKRMSTRSSLPATNRFSAAWVAYTLSQAQRRERTKLKLVSHSELPEWLKNNEYLVRYHRPPLYSWRACARSIFSLHTESGNIWTHLLGALGFLALGVHFFRSDVLALDWAGCLAFGIYFAGAALCLTLSTTYHTFNCHSAKVGKFFCKMDYFGITVLILGSFYPWLYFQFLCEPLKRLVYGLLVTASGLLTMRVSLSHKFGEARYRALRAGIFFSFALVCGVLPSAHYGIQHGWNDLMYKSSFLYILLMVAIYVSGCCVYASRVPERFFPGRCDLAFQSHQIFHVLVLMGALAHYYGLSKLATLRVSQGSCPLGQTDSLLHSLALV